VGRTVKEKKMKHIWGIDLGGTKIEGAILLPDEHLRVLERLRIPTEAFNGYEAVLNNIKKVIDQLSERTGLMPSEIGIGTPGTMDPGLGQMKNCNSTILNGKPLQGDLEKLLGIKVKMSNDANCFAVAEANMGIVKDVLPDARNVFGVIMGTGVGGGIVIDGKVINGKQGIGGEWGHNFLDESGGQCYCGKIGCVERIISGPALERYYHSRSGHKKSLKDIVSNHKTGTDPIATETIDRLIHFFGKALSVIVNILDPDAIVIGGGVGNIEELYDEGVKELEKYVFNHRLDTLILRPKLGDSAGVFGAALL
jgi:predicted NBD/HSP70 family sugar kinase